VPLDEQSISEQATLFEEIEDKIPGKIHELMDDRLNRVGAVIPSWCSRALTVVRSSCSSYCRASSPGSAPSTFVRLNSMR
jgi:hypothetical protein